MRRCQSGVHRAVPERRARAQPPGSNPSAIRRNGKHPKPTPGRRGKWMNKIPQNRPAGRTRAGGGHRDDLSVCRARPARDDLCKSPHTPPHPNVSLERGAECNRNLKVGAVGTKSLHCRSTVRVGPFDTDRLVLERHARARSPITSPSAIRRGGEHPNPPPGAVWKMNE